MASYLPTQPGRRRATIALLLLAFLGSMVHQAGPTFKWDGWSLVSMNWNLWEWYIEDAAISFAYARNWANGDGLVAFVGGERQEGYSNPLWVALMAIFYLFGVDGFWSSKILAMAFGVLTVFFTWRIAVELVDDPESDAPLLAPLFLAAFPTFAFWNASGLENPLFVACLSGGIWRTLVEIRRGGGFPWSAVFYLMLSVTRPEAIMYAAWGGFISLATFVVRGHGVRHAGRWLVAFFAPFLAYHAVRYWYFAWAFPNTYYAKLGAKDFRPFSWGNRGWRQIREWSFDTGLGWFLPVFMAGVTGLKTWRRFLWPALSLGLGFLFLWPDAEITKGWEWWPQDVARPALWADMRLYALGGLAVLGAIAAIGRKEALGVVGLVVAAAIGLVVQQPEPWDELRAWLILTAVLVTLATAVGRKESAGVLLLAGSAVITLFFSVYSGGDWMKGYRWMSFLSPGAAVLFALGARELADVAHRLAARLGAGGRVAGGWNTAGWLVAAALLLGVLPKFYLHSEWFFAKRETGPYSVKRRVEHVEKMADRLFLDGHQYTLDVDMGAHLYWARHEMLDMAGLVDVTIAHHNFGQRMVTKEYVFEEKRPAFAHVHGAWANTSRIPTFAEWKSGYVEYPGYGSRTLHGGNHVRRDLMMRPAWEGTPGREVLVDGGITLAGFDVPSAEISVGKALFLEVGVQYRRAVDQEDFRLLGFLSDDAGHVHTFDLPLGYDFLTPKDWRADEVFTGRFAPVMPRDLPPGTYDLGFVFMSGDGRVLAGIPPIEGRGSWPVGAVLGGVGDAPARFAVGEIRFPAEVVIGPPGTGESAARADFARAQELASGVHCDEAEEAFRLAWRHVPLAKGWREEHTALLADAMAGCYAKAASAADPLTEAPDLLFHGRHWNARLPELIAAMREVGDVAYRRGMDARLERDWEAAYRAFSAAVRANPSLSWARRYAEEARDYRHGIDPETEARKEEERKRAREEAEKRRAEREAAREAAERGPKGGDAPARGADGAAAGGTEGDGDGAER